MKKVSLALFILLGIVAVIFYSLKKENSTYSSCGIAPFLTEKSQVLSYPFSFKHYSSVEEGDFYQTYTGKDTFYDILNQLGVLQYSEAGQKNSVLITYLDKKCDTNLSFDVKSIAGFLLYYFENKKLYTKVFKVVDRNLVIDKFFSTASNSLALRDVYEVGHYVISPSIKTAIFIGAREQNCSYMETNLPLLQYKLRIKK